MVYTDMHYIGFIQACESCGMEKSAADRLYKAALNPRYTRWFRNLGRGTAEAVKGVETAAKATKGFAEQAAKTVGRGASRAWHAAADPVAAAGSRFGRATVEAARAVRQGYRQLIPPTPEQVAANRARRVAKSLAFSPWKATRGFIMKHPIISTVGGITLGAGITNWANRNSLDDNKSKLPTLTPSEKLMFDRAANGYNLPGLGLDPTFFQGEDLPVYW